MILLTLGGLFFACAGDPLVITPGALHFGEVDFQAEPPAAGHNALDLELENTGNRVLDLQIVGLEPERFQLSAQLVADDPPTLAPLEAGQSWVIQVGVIGYVPGEWDTEVSGQLSVRGVGAAAGVSVPWSYTPIRNFNADSGQ